MEQQRLCRPRILHAPPVSGAREPMCKSDEATVCRMLSPKRYAGMVERLQKGSGSHAFCDSAFDLALDEGGSYHDIIRLPRHSVPILRFLALRLARSIFPENFVDANEIRISSEGGYAISAMYSHFIPDDGGVILRRTESMKRYYEAPDREAREALRDMADASERTLCPRLEGEIEKSVKAGILIPHPEANYHLSKERVVFFEVVGIDVPRALDTIGRMPGGMKEPAQLLSMICAVALRSYSMANPGYVYRFNNYSSLDFHEIYAGALTSLLRTSRGKRTKLFGDIHDALHEVFETALFLRMHPEWGPVAEMPASIDKSLI